MSDIRRLSRREALTIAAALAIAITSVAATWEPVTVPAGGPTARPAASPSVPPDRVGAVSTAVGADVRDGSKVVSRLRAGILLPVLEAAEDKYQVLTPCHVTGWVRSVDVVAHAVQGDGPPVVVLDPGHGGAAQPGAVGPRGLREKDVNLDLAERAAALLSGPRRDPIRVFLTRSADHLAGLRFRTTLADRLGASAFVSIHNNASPDGPSSEPGTEAYYQVRSKDSKRLAGLIYEELFETLRAIDAPWVSDDDPGAKYRRNRRGTDFYAVLRGSSVPAVIVEALFISNPAEERLLRDARVRRAIAASTARGVERYLTTDDPGSGFVVPKPLGDRGPRGRLPTGCVDPV